MQIRQVVTLLFCCGLAGVARPADWPQWRGPHRNGVVPALNLRNSWGESGPPVVWTAEVGTGFSAVSIADGRAYVLGNTADIDTVWCLDARTGDVIWQVSYAAPLDPNLFEGGPTSTPTCDGSDVFTFSRSGLALCLDALTGEERWRVDVPAECDVNVPSWGFAGSPVAVDDRVLLNAGSSGVALDRGSGQVRWKSDNSDDAGYATPVLTTLDGRQGALVLSGKALHAIDPASGEELWAHRWITRYGVNAADPLVQDDLIFVTSGYAKGTALLRATAAGAEELWRMRDLRNQMSPGVLLDGFVYAVDGDAGDDCRLKCVEFATGAVRWEESGLGSATLIASGKTLVILSEDGELVLAAASPDSFQPVARAEVLDGKCWTPPALADGHVYCRNAAGRVVCVDLRVSSTAAQSAPN